MQEMIEKLKIKLILLESLSLIFIINGIRRLQIAYNGEKYEALINDDWKKFKSLTNETVGDLFAYGALWVVGIIIFGILVIGFINWKNKIKIINSVAVFVIIIGIAVTGSFMSGIINKYLNYFCGLFAKSYSISFLIGGIILSLVGITILWKAIDINKKSTVHNNVYN